MCVMVSFLCVCCCRESRSGRPASPGVCPGTSSTVPEVHVSEWLGSSCIQWGTRHHQLLTYQSPLSMVNVMSNTFCLISQFYSTSLHHNLLNWHFQTMNKLHFPIIGKVSSQVTKYGSSVQGFQVAAAWLENCCQSKRSIGQWQRTKTSVEVPPKDGVGLQNAEIHDPIILLGKVRISWIL